jgi:hypothetical protein
MEVLAILDIAFVVAFIVPGYGFWIFVIYQMGKLAEAMNGIPGEVRRELDSRSSAVRERQDNCEPGSRSGSAERTISLKKAPVALIA